MSLLSLPPYRCNYCDIDLNLYGCFCSTGDEEDMTTSATRAHEGWKLVPIEPTKEMWDAVNKLDNQMAAGGYDGKGCTIEQAWDCMLANAPTHGNSVLDAIANAGFKLMRNSGGFWLLNAQDEGSGGEHEA